MDAKGATRCLARLCELTGSDLVVSIWPVVLRIARLCHGLTVDRGQRAYQFGGLAGRWLRSDW